MMKQVLYISIAVLLWSCGASDTADAPLSKLVSERDSLKEIYEETGNKIKQLDKKIAGLNPAVEKKKKLVSAKVLQPRKFEHYFEVHGKVETDQNVLLSPEIPGLIKSIPVQEGQEVAAGQPLAYMDTEVIEKNINELETAYELAKTLFDRQKNLWEQSIGSEIQFLEAKNKKESLEQKLNTLKSQKEKSMLTAPFSGVVDEIFLKTGENAVPQLPVLRLVNLDKISVQADVSEKYIGKVRKGTTVYIDFPSLGEAPEAAEIDYTGQFIHPNNRTFKIKINLPNREGKFKPNMLAVLKIRDFERDSAIVVPSDIVQQDSKGNDFLFIAGKDGTMAEKKMVKSGPSYGGETIILEGLEEGEKVIIKGARVMRDGESIEMIPGNR